MFKVSFVFVDEIGQHQTTRQFTDSKISYQKSSERLDFIIDMRSTTSQGLKLLGEGEWKHKKHQPEYRRQWCKLHIGIDAETLQIRAVHHKH